MTYVSLTIRILLTLAFVAAGGAKIIGVDMMVATFDQVGLGQWLRYLTGIIELGGAVLLWLPGLQAIGAIVLGGTMVGAVLTHLFRDRPRPFNDLQDLPVAGRAQSCLRRFVPNSHTPLKNRGDMVR
mgnify:CR=1 FL=1